MCLDLHACAHLLNRMIELTKIEYNTYTALVFACGAVFAVALLFAIGVIKLNTKKEDAPGPYDQ